MSVVPIVTDEEASGEARTLIEHSKKMYGRAANAVRVAAHTPKIAQALFGFIVASQRQEISQNLTSHLKALVTLKTSLLNGCKY